MTDYLENIETLLSRTLSLQDQEETSTSMGSFDRTWWCWKFTDFSAPRFQEGIYTLAWMYAKYDGISESEKPFILKNIEAGIRFWISLQHVNGSYDEAYPFEQSLAATAFTVFYIGSAVEILVAEIDHHLLEDALNSITRAANWLQKNDEHHGTLSNHLAAAAAALQVADDLQANVEFSEGSKRFINRILNEQSKDGYYQEYFGADPGYQTHGMFYLCDIHRRTKCPKLLASLIRSSDFIQYFIHPDGTAGGEYASRGTKFYYPAAFEYLAPHCESARVVLSKQLPLIRKNKIINAETVDMWNFFPLLNNYLHAADWKYNGALVGFFEPLNKYTVFYEAGFVKGDFKNIEVVASARFGGSIKIWNRNSGLAFENSGYFYKEKNGFYISQNSSTFEIIQSSDKLVIRVLSRFVKAKNIRLNPVRLGLFRCFMGSFGRSQLISTLIKKALVTVLISKKTQSKIVLDRTVEFTEASVEIIDKINCGSIRLNVLKKNVPFHMGSARYSTLNEFLSGCKSHKMDETRVNSETVELRHKYEFNQ